jgi:polygalacturonase
MFKRYLGYLFLLTFLILTTTPCVLCTQNIISVNVTSVTDAQTTINSAINSVALGATSSNPGYVLLTAGTYNISGPILLKSNVVLKGAGDGTIIFANG